MVKREAINLSKKYALLARSLVNWKKALLFGSWANGNASADSDIDIALIVEEMDGDMDILTLMQELYRLTEQVNMMIEPHLMIRESSNPSFLMEIERTGILLNILGSGLES